MATCTLPPMADDAADLAEHRSIIDACLCHGIPFTWHAGTAAEPHRTRADRRAGRGSHGDASGLSNVQAEGIANVLEVFKPGTVRIRLIRALGRSRGSSLDLTVVSRARNGQ